MRSGRSLALTSLFVVSLSLVARAEPVPSLDLRNFHPPTDPNGSLFLEPTATPGPWAWNVAAWVSYAYRSVTLQNDSGDTVEIPLEHQLSLDYLASLGIGERLAIGLSLPTVLYQSGDRLPEPFADGQLPRTALGDAAFNAKATLLPTTGLGGFGLAALGRVTAPTGDQRSYLSDGTVTGELRLLGELKLIALDLRTTAGARVRGEKRSFVGQEFGHDLPWGVGVTMRPQAFGLDQHGRWLWTAELRGQAAITPAFGSGRQSPLLAGLSARYTVGDLSGIAGVELPVKDAVGSPAVRVIIGIGWAPRFYDQDGDGIADEDDECPELAEDMDGFEDHDGCPDFDNDDDGVPDEEDLCPLEPEDEDGFEDDDGCPDPDNDGDGILDEHDACPNEAGPASNKGCPVKDSDGDGIPDHLDKCPHEPEDMDGFQDEDGCPDPDNDGDGVLDVEDACPNVPGIRRSDPKLNGCPSPDTDGDTFADAEDKCADEPEDFDGVEDDDGCPDDDSAKPLAQRAKPLLTVEQRGDERFVRFRVLPTFLVQAQSVELDPKTVTSVRALAQQLNAHPEWVALVGVRPAAATPAAEQAALSKSFAIVHALRAFTYRDEVAESIGWGAVKALPDAQKNGLGVLVLAPPPAPASPPGLPRLKMPPRGPQLPVPPPPPPPSGQTP
jgi:OmpA-OmpF porin, OOP family